jgi:DNA polymerase-3 subunit delta
MIYFIYGEDHFRVREQARAIREAAERAKVPVVVIEAEEAEPSRLEEHLKSSSLFAAKRAMFVRNPFSDGSNAFKEALTALLGSLPSDLILVVTEEGEPDRRTRLFAELSRRAKTYQKSPLSGRALEEWVERRAAGKGLTLDGRAVALLSASVGHDLFQLEAELEKLSLFAGRRTVTEKDVAELVPVTVPPAIFDLLDAVATGDRRAGLLLEQLLRDGQEPLYILSMLAYQVRNLLLARDLLDRRPGVTPSAATTILRLHPYVAHKTLAQAKKFSFDELIAWHSRLTDLDVAVKTGALEGADALILFTSRAVG